MKLEKRLLYRTKMDEFHGEGDWPLLESNEDGLRAISLWHSTNFPFVLARLERISAKRRNTNTLRKSDKNRRYSEWRKLCVSFRIRRRGIFRTDIRKILGR